MVWAVWISKTREILSFSTYGSIKKRASSPLFLWYEEQDGLFSGRREEIAQRNSQNTDGYVTGGPKFILRLEGLVIFLLGSLLYFCQKSNSWYIFALLFFAPDVSLLAYLVGKKTGAFFYNLFHSYLTPLGLGVILFWMHQWELCDLVSIWVAHVGFDRALGFGLKYGQGFKFTHLGRIGKKPLSEAV